MPDSRAPGVSRTLWAVLGLNLLVTAAKQVIGFRAGSLAVVADGFHSLVDSSSNVIGLVGVWVAARPVDANHPYGHRRYESLATLGIGGLLLLAAWEILRAAAGRLLGGAPPEVTTTTLLVVGLTLPVNLAVVMFETRAARQYHSSVLYADATHTRTDLLVTITVLASLAGGLWGLEWLDVAVAGGVVVVIVRAALGILRGATLVLTDSAVADPQAVARIALGVSGVTYVHRVRSRGTPDAVQIDLHVKVNPAMTTRQAHGIASEVEHRLAETMPNVVDSVVHIEPALGTVLSQWEEISLSLRELAEGLGVGLHDLHVHQESDGSFTAEVHLEMDAGLSLAEAHALADEFEARTHDRWPQITTLISHLEPLAASVEGEASDPQATAQMASRIQQLADEMCGPGAAHSVQVHRAGGHLTATLHVIQPGRKPLLQAHALAEELERRLLREVPRLRRVSVHVEPPGSP